MFEIVKMTHVCHYWRSTLISYPYLWCAVFVQKHHKDLVVACLERSRRVPLTVRLDLVAGVPYCLPGDTREQVGVASGLRIDGKNPDHCRTSLGVEQIRRIRKLDVHLSMFDDDREDSARNIENALDGVEFFASPLPVLENLSLYADQDYAIKIYPKLPKDIFRWESLPPTTLRHLALHGCYSDPTQAIRNLTSLELSGLAYANDPMTLDQHTFLPFISASPPLVSLSLAHCKFPHREELSGVTPVRLPELRSLRLMGARKLPSFPGLIDVPALNSLSSLRILLHRPACSGFSDRYLLVRAESDDGFQLVYDTDNHSKAAKGWLGLTRDADPNLAFVRFEGRRLGLARGKVTGISFLPLFVNAEVLEIGASFADAYSYKFWKKHGFWKDLEEVGPQLTTLRLEVTRIVHREVAKSVEELFRARLQKGMPLTKLERMMYDETNEEWGEDTEEYWEEFRAGLSIDQYLIVR